MVDPIMSDHLTKLMLRLKNELKLTSVVVTHDLDLMNHVADRVVFLSDGKVVKDIGRSTEDQIVDAMKGLGG